MAPAPLVERHDHMTDLEVVIEEILQDKIAIDFGGSGIQEAADAQ